MDKSSKVWNVALEQTKPLVAVRRSTQIILQPMVRNNDAWACLVCAIIVMAALIGVTIVFWAL